MSHTDGAERILSSRTLARETGERLGYDDPTELEETIMAWVRDQAPEST